MKMLSAEARAYNAGWYIGYHHGYNQYKEQNAGQN